MKTFFRISLVLLTISVSAQHTKLLDFTGTANGDEPWGSLISDGVFLYGMTSKGGSNDQGTIFKIKPDGTQYTKLLDFSSASTGGFPFGSLVSDGTFLYGMTEGGGTNNLGVIFKIKSDGTGFVKLLDFAGTANGSEPYGSLFFDGTFLYGMTTSGGTNNVGTIFKIMPDGTGYTKLLDMAATANGSYPNGSLISDGTFLYGMASEGGTSNEGTVFKINKNGTGFIKLLNFTGAANGSNPFGSLLYDGTFLYGMTYSGGTINDGTIFKIKTDGTGYVRMFNFNLSIGDRPFGDLISDGTFLYGMTYSGGSGGTGNIFKIKPDGTGFQTLHDFANVANGWLPYGSLLLEGSSLYGMTQQGGIGDAPPFNGGTVFKYALSVSIPTISSFTPSSGPVGTAVTITGTNFSTTPANNTVTFNGTTATVSASTATSITVTVPPNTTTGKITVTVAGNTATSATDFTVTTGAAINITTQPSSSSVCNNASATFTTAATGTTNITYQWQFATSLTGTYSNISNGSGYINTTTASLSVNTTGNFGGGFYRCQISGDMATAVFTNGVQLTITTCTSNQPPDIQSTTIEAPVNGKVTLYLASLLSDPDDNLDLSTLKIIVPPLSGATATIDGQSNLILDYTGISFSGTEKLTIEVCDLSGSCAQNELDIEVAGDIVVFNAVSPNGDGKNDFLFLQHVDLLEETKENHVTILNRWGSVVWEGDNYDNTSVVFSGQTKNGNDLPSGNYFYRIEFSGNYKKRSGFLALKR